MRKLILILPLVCFNTLYCQDTVRVLFVYGSKPKAKQESKWFGGIHGGHVSVGYRDRFASFIPDGKFHVTARKHHPHSRYVTESGDGFVYDTGNCRYLIISIPVTPVQRRFLDSVTEVYLKQTPYDYAFIGMRCASAAYDLLSAAGIYPKSSRTAMVRKYFYPKRLRKMILRDAEKNKWKVVYRPGRKTRKWERD